MNRFYGFSYQYWGRRSRQCRRWTPYGSRAGHFRSHHGSYSPKFYCYMRYRFFEWLGRA